MVTTFGVKDFVIATAVLLVAAPMVYFGCRGSLDTFTLRVTDVNPLHWFFRWRYRGQPRELTDRAFIRFFWRMNLALGMP
jgi:hypothetical protein